MHENEESQNLTWIGEHCHEEPSRSMPGMLGSIALTAVRGSDPVDFLTRLGADQHAIEQRTPYRDYQRPDEAAYGSVGMFGTSGEWVYLLQDRGASWFHKRSDMPEGLLPRKGEELVCIAPGVHPDSTLLYAPGDGSEWWVEFGESFLDSSQWSSASPYAEDKVRALDAALREAGAVNPDAEQFESEEAYEDWWEEHSDELFHAHNEGVYRAVGTHFGLAIPRHQVEQGLLPAVALERGR